MKKQIGQRLKEKRFYGVQVIGNTYHCYLCMNTSPFMRDSHDPHALIDFVSHMEYHHGANLNKGRIVLFFGLRWPGGQFQMAETCIEVSSYEQLKNSQKSEYDAQEIIRQELGSREV